MIELIEVTKRYGDVVAVHGISFQVDRGEIIGLVGPNGAGKTTTMKMITGYLAPTSGKLVVDGKDVLSDPIHAQARIGYLPENNPLYPEMVVQDYLSFMGKMRGLRGSQLAVRLRTAAAACDLRSVIQRPIRQLSKGFRQRVGIAQAIIHDPDILILDEPTSGLDPNQIVEIRDLIQELGRNKTVILSTHILSEVEETCSRAIMIVAGRLAVDEKIETLSGGQRTRLALSKTTDGVLKKLEGLDEVVKVEASNDKREFWIESKNNADLAPTLFALAVEQGWQVAELARERRSLENVFREASRAAGGEKS
ncbi:MAG: ATP-binding cassette domain-containing protein [Planctomycetota bacterium]